MHRTQLYLEDGQFRLLRSRARREGKTLAALVRELLDTCLTGPAKTSDPFDSVIGMARGDGAAVAESYEDYLYGDRR